MTALRDLADASRDLANLRGRRRKVERIAALLRGCGSADVSTVARWMTGERMTNGKEETMGLPGAHLIDSKGCRIELWELADQSGSEHTQKPVNHFGMEVDDLALVYENAIAAGAKAEMPPSTVTSGDLHVEAAFIRGINDERIELVRFLKE